MLVPSGACLMVVSFIYYMQASEPTKILGQSSAAGTYVRFTPVCRRLQINFVLSVQSIRLVAVHVANALAYFTHKVRYGVG